jgi:hypothetical protein
VAPKTSWSAQYYQYANRLAHLSFLREQGVNAHLVFLYLTGDTEMRGPSTPEKWLVAIGAAHQALGLPE